MNEESESILTLTRRESQALYDVAVIRYNSESEYMYYVGGLYSTVHTCICVMDICVVFCKF